MTSYQPMLKRLFLLLTGWLLVQSMAAQVSSHSFSLDDYRWKNRLLLVFFDTPEGEKAYQAQRQHFEQQQAQLSERDLLILDDPSVVNDHSERFNITDIEDGFTMILIGKDGGQKATYEGLTPPSRIFERIDQMPMRRAEMRKN